MKPNRSVIPSDSEDPILTTGAAAALLGVSVSTMQLWINSGAIASWKTPGGHRRVRRSAVTALGRKDGHDRGAISGVESVADQEADEFCLRDNPGYLVGDDEADRLKALAGTGLIDTPPEQVFDRLTWLASKITGTPISLISLLTSRRQWFKSRVGIEVCETPREWAFCGHAIQNSQPFVVNDATKDERFLKNPLVTSQPYIRFYAGVPLTDESGHHLGTLCVLDHRPRSLEFEQLQALKELAAIASEEIARRS